MLKGNLKARLFKQNETALEISTNSDLRSNKKKAETSRCFGF
jgi:hypothetical protein